MVYEVQTQPMKTFAWRSWYPRVALMKLRPQVFILELQHFIFMKLRPLVFILCKHFTISFPWNSGPWISSCARMSPFNFHESQAPGFHPVQECHHLIFMILSLMFSARACISPLNCQSGICQSCLNKPVAASAARLFMGCWLKVS